MLNYPKLTNDENNFTKSQKNDNMEVKNKTLNTVNTFQKNQSKPKSMVSYPTLNNGNGIVQQLQKNSNQNKDRNNIKDNFSAYKYKVPSEKLEVDRLQRLTGEYNLNKVDSKKLDDSIRLKNKTADDYYSHPSVLNENNKRLDEAFGPKTDFSISNFENNYDKFNQEEKEMIVHKMQLEFNKQGYTDRDGYKLKTDGKYGNKTKSVYEQYIKDNESDYKEAIENKAKFKNLNYSDNSNNDSYTLLAKNTPTSNYEITSSKSYPNTTTKQTANNESSTTTTKKIVPTKESPRIYYTTYDEPEKVQKRISNPEIKKKADNVIKDNAQYIKSAAKKFGVNPVILGTCIYAEHMLNVDFWDNFDVHVGRIGRDTSIGVAQVLLSTAKGIEDAGYMPKITASNKNSLINYLGNDENLLRIEALKDPETNIMYAAAYLKYFQDKWEYAYPEIDGKTAILATLYNIGEKKDKPPHANPQPNDFGRIARNSYYDVAELLGL